jgi:hypothetical protein
MPLEAQLLPRGVIGNTRDFDSLIPGSSPGGVALIWSSLTFWVAAAESTGRAKVYLCGKPKR